MSESEKNQEKAEQLGDHIGKLVEIYNNWFDDDFLNKPAHIYVEAIFHYACRKIDNGDITVEQERFLVEALQEAQNYKLPTITYDWDLDDDQH